MSLTLASFAEGLPPVFLPLIHYSLLEYSAPVAHFINESGFDLLAKNDLRFIESVYKLLLTSFSYKPSITVQQFFLTGFAERKILLCCDICQTMKLKHAQLVKVIAVKPAISHKIKSHESQEEVKQQYKVIKHEVPITQSNNLREEPEQSY